jgi:hypothetical protein
VGQPVEFHLEQLCCAQADARGKDGNRYKLRGHAGQGWEGDGGCLVADADGGDCCVVLGGAVTMPCGALAVALIETHDGDRVPLCPSDFTEHLGGADLWVLPG